MFQNAGFCLHRNAAAVSWETHIKQLTARRKHIGPGLSAQKFKEFRLFGESLFCLKFREFLSETL